MSDGLKIGPVLGTEGDAFFLVGECERLAGAVLEVRARPAAFLADLRVAGVAAARECNTGDGKR